MHGREVRPDSRKHKANAYEKRGSAVPLHAKACLLAFKPSLQRAEGIDKGNLMSIFQETMLTVGTVLAMTAVPVCATTVPDSTAFHFTILPHDKCRLDTVDVPNVDLKYLCLPLKVAESSGGKLSRKEWLQKVVEACRNAKGVLQDGGQTVSCTLPASPTNSAKSLKPPPGDDPDALNCPPNCLKPANSSVGNPPKK